MSKTKSDDRVELRANANGEAVDWFTHSRFTEQDWLNVGVTPETPLAEIPADHELPGRYCSPRRQVREGKRMVWVHSESERDREIREEWDRMPVVGHE